MKNWMKSFFSEPRKNVKLKDIESYKPNESLIQINIVLLSNYLWDGFKYIFTIVNHFTKHGCVIPLNDKKAETILRV